MAELGHYFEVNVSEDKMMATIIQFNDLKEDDRVTEGEIKQFLREQGVVHGLVEAEIEKLVNGAPSLHVTRVIANGDAPINGTDAFLETVQFQKKIRDVDSNQPIDVKDLLTIPEVKQGEMVGRKVPATAGTNGKNVLGAEIEAKPGKDFKLRPGKNTRVDEEGLRLYALVHGQMSINQNVIHVYPVYEVKGDLDLKTGNISFIGNVNIQGNVPAGFEVKAKGDIRVNGTVESATLEAEGSIFVGAGIVGQGKGKIIAKGNLHTTFINQGNVEVEGDIEVAQSILHSNCTAGGRILCIKGKGNIAGGSISAGASIHAKEIGNTMQTKTLLFVGARQKWLDRESELKQQVNQGDKEMAKLSTLLKAIVAKEEQAGLTASERVQKLRVRNAMKVLAESLDTAKEELVALKEKLNINEHGLVLADQALHQNVEIHFGKYRRRILSKHEYVRVALLNSEITLSPQ